VDKLHKIYIVGVRHFIGGYFSGMALVLTGHPFDTLKVRMQTEGANGRFQGPLHCARQTLAQEGFLGFYKGVTPPLFATGIINALLFGMQGAATRKIREYNISSKNSQPTFGPPTVREASLAAIFTGFAISFIVTPMEGVKSRLQVQYAVSRAATVANSPALYHGPLDCIKFVLRNEGLKGLYRGFSAVAFCRMSNYAYFGAYELYKQTFLRFQANSSNSPKHSNNAGSTKLSPGLSMCAGGLAGISYWFSCYPVDLIKAKMMVAAANSPHNSTTLGPIATAKNIYHTVGWRGFFVGFTPCLIRAFPANAAAFCTFELVMYLLPLKLK
jgi:solute carrier family 25 carnitine/acylcarnitine transporter 20/29